MSKSFKSQYDVMKILSSVVLWLFGWQDLKGRGPNWEGIPQEDGYETTDIFGNLQ